MLLDEHLCASQPSGMLGLGLRDVDGRCRGVLDGGQAPPTTPRGDLRFPPDQFQVVDDWMFSIFRSRSMMADTRGRSLRE
jgi:hypothetical protein